MMFPTLAGAEKMAEPARACLASTVRWMDFDPKRAVPNRTSTMVTPKVKIAAASAASRGLGDRGHGSDGRGSEMAVSAAAAW
jgi:hypothetical protein